MNDFYLDLLLRLLPIVIAVVLPMFYKKQQINKFSNNFKRKFKDERFSKAKITLTLYYIQFCLLYILSRFIFKSVGIEHDLYWEVTLVLTATMFYIIYLEKAIDRKERHRWRLYPVRESPIKKRLQLAGCLHFNVFYIFYLLNFSSMFKFNEIIDYRIILVGTIVISILFLHLIYREICSKIIKHYLTEHVHVFEVYFDNGDLVMCDDIIEYDDNYLLVIYLEDDKKNFVYPVVRKNIDGGVRNIMISKDKVRQIEFYSRTYLLSQHYTPWGAKKNVR